MKKGHDVVLITVRGPDAPGITSTLTQIIAEGKSVRILDIEQTVVHGKLLLSILLGFDKGAKTATPILKDLLMAAKELGVGLDFEIFENNLKEREDLFEYVITCLGEDVGAYQISRISSELAVHGINIDKIARLSHGNIRCIEMVTHAAKPIDTKKVSRHLLPLSNKIGVDIAIQKYGLLRQSKRLVVLDMDSTLIQSEVINELAKKSGKGKKVMAITEKVLNAEMSFAKGLRERVALLAGLNENVLEAVYKKIKLTEGAEKFMHTLKKLGYKTALISGGFNYYTQRLKGRFGFDYAYANDLEIKDGKLTGKLRGRIIDTKAKADILDEIAKKEDIGLDQIIAIGDGANDIAMLSKAGLGVAFRAKPIVIKSTKYSITKHKGLDSILFLLGIPEKEVLRLRK